MIIWSVKNKSSTHCSINGYFPNYKFFLEIIPKKFCETNTVIYAIKSAQTT